MSGNKKRHYRKPELEEIIESVETVEEVAVEEAEEVIQEEPVISEPVFGTVCNCYMLNIRNNPSIEADKICTLHSKKLVKIVEEINTDWIKVELVDGIVGYCLAKYIAKMTI
jgi:hypothetical protein